MKNQVKQIAVAVALIAFSGHQSAIHAQSQVMNTEAEVTCMAESPVDGSLWMGTANNGLYRLSKTGSRLHFGASGGKLGSDSILYICFDSEAKLWILGAEGSLTSYTAKEGFRKNRVGDEKISGAIYLPKSDKIMLSSVTKLFAFNPKSEKIESSVEIPFEPINLKLSADSSYVWIFGESKVARLADNGEVIEWSGVGDVSNMIPLEFETHTEQNGAEGHIWLYIIISLVIICGTVIVVLSSRRKKTEVVREVETDKTKDPEAIIGKPLEEQAAEEPGEQIPEPETIPEKPKKKPAAVTKSSAFTTRILMLIDEHYKDPDFDVDSIAALTGLSRIHVNRKLKAEGSPSPSALIRDRRMEVAKYYLLQSEMPMAKIASECGFRSASYFTTAFKDYTGVTPSEFVAQNKL